MAIGAPLAPRPCDAGAEEKALESLEALESLWRDEYEVLVAIALVGTLYFWPTLTAITRRHPACIGIILLNVLLGFTLIGWIVALVWSYTGGSTPRLRGPFEKEDEAATRTRFRWKAAMLERGQRPVTERGSAIIAGSLPASFCTQCGRAPSPGDAFCAGCGATLSRPSIPS